MTGQNEQPDSVNARFDASPDASGAFPALTGDGDASAASLHAMVAVFLDELNLLERRARSGAPPPPSTATTLTRTKATVAAPALPTTTTKRRRIRKPSAPGTVRSHWRRQKEEFVALRESVELLQTELGILQARRAAAEASGAGASGKTRAASTRDAQRSDMEAEKWMKRTAVEIDAWRRANFQNRKLKKLVASTLETTKSVEEAFAKYPTLSMSELLEFASIPVVAVKIHPAGVADSQIYAVLEQSLETQYMGLLPLIRDNGPESQDKPEVREIKIQVDDEAGASVQLNNSWIEPFSVEMISDVAWQNDMVEYLQTKSGAVKVVQKSESTLYIKKEYNLPNTLEVLVNIRTVFKRFVEDHRVIMLWESMGEWSSSESNASFPIRDRGWGVVQPFPDPSTRSPVSIIRSSMFITPEIKNDADFVQATQVKLLADMVVPTYQLTLAARKQQLENMLLDHSIKLRG